MYQTNPIQQRIELLADKWNEALLNTKGRVIRINAKDNEQEFIDTFFQYMLAMDSNTDDIALLFESPLSSVDDFSFQLLKELEVLIKQWNTTVKPKDFKFEPITWKPDYSLTDKNNPSALFIQNINNFARYLLTDDDRILTAIIYFHTQDIKLKTYWLSKAIDFGIISMVRIAITDIDPDPVFNAVANNYNQQVITIDAQLNADTAVSQMSAMGDPADPATSYRYSFILLTQAITQRNEKEVKINSNKCLEIARENLNQNPYWIMQLVVIYTALANHFMGNKDFKTAIDQATLAIKATEESNGMIEDKLSARMNGQAYILRASLLCVEKKWEQALKDAVESCNHYRKSDDIILQIEAFRMCGYISQKNGDKNEAVDFYLQGLKIGSNLPSEAAVASSLPLLTNQLLLLNYQNTISYNELDALVKPLFGDNWENIISDYTNIEKSKIIEYA